MKTLNSTTKKVIKDLQDDLEEMLKMDSNIEVIWKLENLHSNNVLMQSANLIRKSLSHEN